MKLRAVLASLAILNCGLVAAIQAQTGLPSPVEGGAFFQNKIRPVLIERCFECQRDRQENQRRTAVDDRDALRLAAMAGWRSCPEIRTAG